MFTFDATTTESFMLCKDGVIVAVVLAVVEGGGEEEEMDMQHKITKIMIIIDLIEK